jgi:hypothetical protein
MIIREVMVGEEEVEEERKAGDLGREISTRASRRLNVDADWS